MNEIRQGLFSNVSFIDPYAFPVYNLRVSEKNHNWYPLHAREENRKLNTYSQTKKKNQIGAESKNESVQSFLLARAAPLGAKFKTENNNKVHFYFYF